MPWREVEIGNAPNSAGIYRLSSRRRGNNRRGYVVRYVGQAINLRTRLVRGHEHFVRGDKVEVFVINDPQTKYRRVAPEDRRRSMTKLDYKERMELHLQLNANPQSCSRNTDLKTWRRNWIDAGSNQIRRW